MSRTPQVTSLLSSWFWLAYLAIPAYGLYKLFVMVRPFLFPPGFGLVSLPHHSRIRSVQAVCHGTSFLFPPAFGLVSLPRHPSLRSVQAVFHGFFLPTLFCAFLRTYMLVHYCKSNVKFELSFQFVCMNSMGL